MLARLRLAAEPLTELRGRALLVVVGCFVCQMGLGLGYVLSPLAGPMIEELGMTRADYGLARATQTGAVALASPFVGLACVRYGARAVLTASVLLLCASLAGMAGMDSFLQYCLLSVVFGIGTAGVGDITVGAGVAEWVRRARGLALGVGYTGSNVAGAVASPAAVHLAGSGDWRPALLAVAGAALVLLLPFASLAIRPAPPERAPDPEAPGGGDPARRGRSPGRPAPDLDLRQALRTRSFWALAFALFCVWFYFLAMMSHLVLFLEDAGLSRARATGYFSAAVLLGLVSKVGAGAVADRMRPRTAMLANTGLMALSSLLVLLVPRPGLLELFVLSYGVSVTARDVTYPLSVAECFGLRHLAAIYGALTVTLLPGGLLGPAFAGYVFDRTGGYAPAFACFAALNLLSLLALLALRVEAPPEARARARPKDLPGTSRRKTFRA